MLMKNLTRSELVTIVPQRLALELMAGCYYFFTGQFSYTAAAICALLSLPKYVASTWKRRSSAGSAPLAKQSVVWAFFIRGKRQFSQIGTGDIDIH